MCFKRISDYKVSPGITCFKAMHYKKGRLSPEFYNEKTYKLGDTIEAAKLPRVSIPFKYWFKKKDFRKKIKKELAAKRIDGTDRRKQLGREVVHSFFSERRAELWSRGEDLVIVECLIPEGEIYWENIYAAEYASFSIKLIRIL